MSKGGTAPMESVLIKNLIPHIDATYRTIATRAGRAIEGHSMGGWTVLAAATAMPDGYKSLVLEGSSTGKPFAAEGTPKWPRNLAVVFSQYDEFSLLMWGSEDSRKMSQSAKLAAAFGVTGPIEPGKVYELQLSNLMTGNLFPKGHRFRVQISAAFFPHFSRNLHTGKLETSESGEMRKATITIHHDKKYPSRIVLPVISR